MMPQNTKTVAFRNQLRQSLQASDWRSRVWAEQVLAAECMQGWAGRQRPDSGTMLRVYIRGNLRPKHIQEMATLFQQCGVPPFNLIPIRNYSQEIRQNRLPKGDTQDRFWLLRGYTHLDDSHWDHWVLTKFRWQSAFKPTAQEALRILNDEVLFQSMLEQDWQLYDDYRIASYWFDVVVNNHHQWPNYSTAMQVHGNATFDDLDKFIAHHTMIRQQYLHPSPMDVLPLP